MMEPGCSERVSGEMGRGRHGGHNDSLNLQGPGGEGCSVRKRNLQGGSLLPLDVTCLWWRELLRKSHLLRKAQRGGPGGSGSQPAPF